MNTEIKLLSENCVNSNWKARWLADENEEHCECGFKCKVKVKIETTGHPPYTYIVTKKEYKNLLLKHNK